MIKLPISKFEVREKSMEPAFCDKDRVLTLNYAKVQKGSVVTANVGGTVMLKRVKSIGKKIVLHSDNKRLAKREYEVAHEDIIGRVFLKY